MISTPVIFAAGSATFVVPVKLSVSIPSPPVIESPAVSVVTIPLKVSAPEVPAKSSAAVVSVLVLNMQLNDFF